MAAPHAEPVAMIFAARDETGHAFELTGLPELRVGMLDPRAAEVCSRRAQGNGSRLTYATNSSSVPTATR
jgi:hypothetical protein